MAYLSVSNQLVITGVPETDVTTDYRKLIKDLFSDLAKVNDVQLSEHNIVYVQHMGWKPLDSQPSNGRIRSRAILVELASPAKCNQIIRVKQKHPNLFASSIDFTLSSSRININHRIPLELQKLRDAVRKNFTEISPRSIWINNGDVFLRKDPTTKHIQILPSTDLSLIELQLSSGANSLHGCHKSLPRSSSPHLILRYQSQIPML